MITPKSKVIEATHYAEASQFALPIQSFLNQKSNMTASWSPLQLSN